MSASWRVTMLGTAAAGHVRDRDRRSARCSAWLIERFGLRPLQGSARIAPLLATIGISFVLDQLVQLIFAPDPRALPSPLPDWRFQIGGGTIGALDLLIAGDRPRQRGAAVSCFLRFTKLGWAVRATAQDRDAAQQMGVDVNAVNQHGVRDRLGARRV